MNAPEILVHWLSVDIHRTEQHAGAWDDCQVESCRTAREALASVQYVTGDERKEKL